MELEKEYWMVVWNKTTGEVKNAKLKHKIIKVEELTTKFELKNPEYRIIHIGEGNLPPKSYRSLDYIS